MGSLDVLVLPIGQVAFVDLEGLTQEFPRETGHLGHWMSEGYWGLVWTFPGVLLWVVRMALELFWAFPAIWAVPFLPFPPLPFLLGLPLPFPLSPMGLCSRGEYGEESSLLTTFLLPASLALP